MQERMADIFQFIIMKCSVSENQLESRLFRFPLIINYNQIIMQISSELNSK